MKNFSVKIGGENVQVEKNDDKNFTIHSKDGDKHLRLKEDNDGGNHWFEGTADSEPPKVLRRAKLLKLILQASSIIIVFFKPCRKL